MLIPVLTALWSVSSAHAGTTQQNLAAAIQKPNTGAATVQEMAHVYSQRLMEFSQVLVISNLNLEQREILIKKYLAYAETEINSQCGEARSIHDYFISSLQNLSDELRSGRISSALARLSEALQFTQSFK